MAKGYAEEGVRWLPPDGCGADDGLTRRSWLAGRQRPFAATRELVGLRWLAWMPLDATSASARSWEGQRPKAAMMALVLAGAGAVDDEFVRAQPGRLLLCFGQRDHRAAQRPTNADDREHVPGFLGYQQRLI